MPRDPDDAPTKPDGKVTASYSVFRDESARIADELERASILMARRIDLVDIAGSKRAAAIAQTLRALAFRFARWPKLPAAEVAAERTDLTRQFFEAVEEALRLLEQLPSHPTLGQPTRR